MAAALSAHTCASISWPTVAESSQASLAKALSETSSDDESEQIEEDRSVHTPALMRFALLFLAVIGYFDSQTGGDLWTQIMVSVTVCNFYLCGICHILVCHDYHIQGEFLLLKVMVLSCRGSSFYS